MFSHNSIASINLRLRKAANDGETLMVNQLLKEGASINSKGSESGETALHRAAKKGFIEVIKTLINHGADIAIENTNKLTAQEIAKENQQQNAAELLSLVSLAYKAESFAREYYTLADSYHTLTTYRTRWKELFNSSQSQITAEIKTLFAQYSYDYSQELTHALRLYELYCASKIAKEMEQDAGLCMEFARASYLFIMANLYQKTECHIDQLGIQSVSDGVQSHVFVMFNIPVDANFGDLDSFKNTIVCDSSPNRIGPAVYFVNPLIKNSSIGLIQERAFRVFKPLELKPSVSLPHYEAYCKNLLLKTIKIYPELSDATLSPASSVNCDESSSSNQITM